MQYREIPYNYSSFSDKEIVCKFLGEDIWQTLQHLRNDRNTGRSAKMLFEVLGDIWVVVRNPYLQEDLIDNKKRFNNLIDAMNHRLNLIESRIDGNQKVVRILQKTRHKVEEFKQELQQFANDKKRITKVLRKITSPNNIRFDPLSRSTHATDATDWRVEYPLLVITPDYEHEVGAIVKACIALGLTIIPRGGGTGYTGACVPLTKNSVVINTEKLTSISSIYKVQNQHIIRVGSGVITGDVAAIATRNNLVFAVDPTSMESCTIGGNISMNAGGKKALRYGTTIDNLLSWKMVDSDGEVIEITRLNPNFDKIQLLEEIQFSIKKADKTNTITIKTADIRKRGLGKDVTNKFMSGLPGVQKEGCDGLITSAEFILHTPLQYTHTLCLEFFGFDTKTSVESINKVKQLIDNNTAVELIGMEHLDYRYIKAVEYSTKADRFELPRMVLLVDIASNNTDEIDAQYNEIIAILGENSEGFIAKSRTKRDQFWQDRKNTAAIAAHTNAFKINEDVVLPLENLAEYSDGIEKINIKLSIENKLQIIAEIKAYLQTQAIEKSTASIELIDTIYTKWSAILQSLEISDRFREIQIADIVISYKKEVRDPLFKLLCGNEYKVQREYIDSIHAKILKLRLFVALHMHAGDGNVHTNIPVHSHSKPMLSRAELVVDEIMALATRLGGVISGEHGIGITKYQYLSQEFKDDFAAYKKQVDKDNHFNAGKLMPGSGLHNAYTPSLELLEQEALILESSTIGEINEMTKSCLRCGKCKSVCTTHVPEQNLLYSPRDKIIGSNLLIEAFLYEEQTRRGIALSHFVEFDDIADHCTVCHLCVNPCPVNIDYGDVTIKMREALIEKKHRKTNIATKLSMAYLNSTGIIANHISKKLLNVAYFSQRLASKMFQPFNAKQADVSIGKPTAFKELTTLLDKPLPKDSSSHTLRGLLDITDTTKVPTLIHPDADSSCQTVFYFPGCGSEKLFSQIGLATVALLYHHKVRVVLPPSYLCCGYPQAASGNKQQAQKMITDNKVLFHRIANTLNYLDINTVLTSCGTCIDQLEAYSLNNIFKDSKSIDIHEYLLENGVKLEQNSQKYLTHTPCHNPIKTADSNEIIAEIMGNATIQESPRCCGESGTFAVARSDIAKSVKARKEQSILNSVTALDLQQQDEVKILTTCPACRQGLSRYEDTTGVSVAYPIEEIARHNLGENWQQEFIDSVHIENILL
jgi:FAD/FMN-containing dehydrogenase/Fe-S oxidoreductase